MAAAGDETENTQRCSSFAWLCLKSKQTPPHAQGQPALTLQQSGPETNMSEQPETVSGLNSQQMGPGTFVSPQPATDDSWSSGGSSTHSSGQELDQHYPTTFPRRTDEPLTLIGISSYCIREDDTETPDDFVIYGAGHDLEEAWKEVTATVQSAQIDPGPSRPPPPPQEIRI